MITAELADGRTLEFPDGTDPSVIQRTVKRLVGGRTVDEPAFEKEAKQIIGTTPAELIAGHPLTRFAAGAARPILGAAQLGAEALGDPTGTETLSQFEKMKKAGMRAYGTEGTDVVGLGGEVMSPVSLAAMRYVKPAATAGARVLQGTALGAGFGAASPVTEGEFGQRKAEQVGIGAGLGTLIPGTFELGRAGLKGIRNVIDPILPGGIDRAAGRTLREAAGEKFDDVLNWLRTNAQLTSGAKPTAAEAAAPAGSAEFSALQRIAEAKRPTQFSDIGAAQEAARQGAIKSFGADKAALETAKQARKAAAKVEYSTAYSKVIRADPELAGIASDPYFKRALPAAYDLAKSKGVDIKQNLTQFLHYIKLGLDDQLGGTAREPLAASEKEAVQGVKTRLLDWMARHNKPYDIARQNFAKASRPINEMQVGQELERALTTPLGTAERPGGFATAMREAPRTIKKATGQPRYEELGEVLQPEQVAKAQGVLSDLARKSKQEQLASAGLPRAKELVGQIEPEVPSAGMFNPAYSVTRAIVNRLLGKIEGKALERLSQIMEDPAVAERIMRMNAGQRAAFVFGVTGEKVSPALVITGTIGANQ